jgi:hypothetical protein
MRVDPFQQLYLSVATDLCPTPLDALPPGFEDVSARAALIHDADPPVIEYQSGEDAFRASLLTALAHMGAVAARAFPHLAPTERSNVLIRLWCGGIAAAKAVRFVAAGDETITPADRTRMCVETIDPMCGDLIYKAGVQAGLALKRLRNEPYSLDGVPEGSPLRDGA